jgi:uncharacterized FlaG/YvyC family protein
MPSSKADLMDIGRVQPSGTGLEGQGVHHGTTQPESREDAAARRHLIQAVKALNGSELFGHDSELTFVFDRHTQKALVRVVDKRTREVIMQIPAEQVLRMAREHSGVLL